MYPQDFLFIFHGFLCVLVYGSSISHTRRGLGAGVTQVVDFDCPEEFGYYPHPTDCTQYYVCVFGGALLESCTGGLMYSHELQTCDWPRNVGCGESGGSDGGTISTVRVTDPRTRNPQQSSRPSTSPHQSPAQVQPTRSSHRQEYNRPQQEEVIQQQIYAEEDLGPAEEIEAVDRQQRVYRGQPSTIGQVQRDRDGLRPLKNSVHSQNVIPTGPGTQDKISVVSFGSQRPSAPRPQEQYRLVPTITADDSILNDRTDNLTKPHSRTRRQVFARPGHLQTTAGHIPFILVSGADSQFAAASFYQNPYGPLHNVPRSSLSQAYGYNVQKDNNMHLIHPLYQYYQPQNVAAAAASAHQTNGRRPNPVETPSNRSQTSDELQRLTKSTIQSEFRPIVYSRPTREQTVKPQNVNIHSTKYIETVINPLGAPVRFVMRVPEATTPKITTRRPKPTAHRFFAPGGFVRVTTEKPEKNSTAHRHHYYTLDGFQSWYGPTKTINTKYNIHMTPVGRTTTERPLSTTRKPVYRYVEKPKDYDFRWHDMESTTKGKRNATSDVGIIQEHRYVQFVKPQEYDYGDEYDEEERKVSLKQKAGTQTKRAPNNRKKAEETQNEKPMTDLKLRKTNMTFFDFLDKVGFKDAEEVKEAIKTKLGNPANDEKFYVPENTVNINAGWKPAVRYHVTTERPRPSANQIEAPRKKIPEEYYENFKPSPTKSFYLTRHSNYDDDDTNVAQSSVTLNNLDSGPRVEQVQAHQLTSALPPLTATPRPIERYNTSQRFQPSQFDQFYTVYDDGVEIYRSNDYGQQYQSPSSTPSSNIANQYRGQTTYKQSLEPVQQQQQQQQHQQQPEPVQQHRNTYTQDLYSPPPVLQDYNDQYNVQIDDQQYQQIGQPTPKSSSRSESTNSSKDALTESSGISVTLVPENVTSKPAPIRRSDTNSYFSISSFGPSTVLLPPLRFAESTQKFADTTFPPPKSEKPLYSDALPTFQNGRANFEPPKNGGALAKTFNSFDNLLSSFIAAVTKSNNRPTPTPSSSTTPPTPVPPKTSPETIVRSEIGRIHHDPVVITENFKIRQPTLRKPEAQEGSKPQVVAVPSSTAVPPKLSQNDYLAYFVEIEPKKPKKEEEGRGGFLLTTPQRVVETTTEPKIITKENLGFGQPDHVGFGVGKNRPFNSFVRIVPTSQTQNVQLGATLELEPIGKPQEKKKVREELENDTIEKQKIIGPITTVSRQPFQPLGKWVIAKNERPQQPPPRFPATPKPNPFEVYERPRDEVRVKVEPAIERERAKEVEAVANRGRGNLLQIHANPLPQLQTTVVSSPYKFLLVDLDSTTEQLSTPAPFSRNPENEDRNRFNYKTNPESRVRARYFDNSSSISESKPFGQEPIQVSTETTTLYLDTDDRIKFSYKTNPESRFRNRFVEDSVIDSKKQEDVEITPKIIVPDIKPEVKPILVLEEKPALSQEEREPEPVLPKKRKPEFRPKNVELESSKPVPRYRSTTESAEVRTTSEEFRKPPRRVVKIHRNDLKNQRLSTGGKLKRIQKPATKSPVVVLEELEEKTLAKENEIHPISTYRPIIVPDGLDAGKNNTRFRFTVEDERDFTVVPDNRIGPFATTERVIIDTVPRGFERPGGRVPSESENDVPDREPSSEKSLYPALKRPAGLKNLTQFENRATTKAYRGKFKPSDSSKLRLRPTTASPDSETTPGPHLTTRQPGGYTIGSTANDVAINRGTPSPNRGTRPTLKPSTAIVSKASEFIDIYRYPPRRPPNLYATPTPDKSAAKCRKDVCLLPDCSCGGKDIPGGYSAEEIPQLVLLTFDDSVNDLNKGLYAELFERGRVNPNGCPISATFYVSHEWTDYSQVQNLYANGHEIASHSITHSFGEQFSQKKWTKEIAGQREILAAYGGVRLEDIRGMRAPFLAVGGNKMFKMLYDSNFTYDSSMPIYENRPPSWPYTLDYKLFHDCMIPPCPTKSYPGVWEVPMVMWQDLNGGRCSMGDACSNPPTADGVYKMLIKNFERHFTTNRAPFGLYYHAAWFTHEHHKEGFIAFLDTIVNMPEVWLVTSWQAIEWVRDPQPLSTVNNFPPFQCNVEKAKKCNNPKVCNLWHKSGVRYMRTCQPCPDVYPWTGKTGVKNSRVDNEIIDE